MADEIKVEETAEIKDDAQATSDIQNVQGGEQTAEEPSLLAVNEPTEAPAEIKYDFTEIFADNPLDDDILNEFTASLKTSGIDNENANKLAGLGVEYARRVINDVHEAYLEEHKSWGEQAKEELGDNFNPTMETALLGVSFIEKEIPNIKEVLSLTGAGNRIEFIKLFQTIGKMVQEDGNRAGKSAIVKKELQDIYTNSDFTQFQG